MKGLCEIHSKDAISVITVQSVEISVIRETIEKIIVKAVINQVDYCHRFIMNSSMAVFAS